VNNFYWIGLKEPSKNAIFSHGRLFLFAENVSSLQKEDFYYFEDIYMLDLSKSPDLIMILIAF